MEKDELKIMDPKHPSGPVKVGKYIVTVDRDLCIGAATCVAIAAKTFELDSDAKAVIRSSSIDEEESVIIESARACPVAAIIIENEKGERIYPK